MAMNPTEIGSVTRQNGTTYALMRLHLTEHIGDGVSSLRK